MLPRATVSVKRGTLDGGDLPAMRAAMTKSCTKLNESVRKGIEYAKKS